MKTIDDKKLDQLISESIHRQHIIESINTQVLADVKKYNRTRRWRTAMRLIAFSFGVPTMMAVMGYSAYLILITAQSVMSYMLVATTIISTLFMAIYSVANFSLDEV